MGPGKILICDDQQIIHDTLKEYLEVEGFAAVSAFDGEESMRLFAMERPDLIILDIMMPEKSGIDVCRDIRKDSSVPIIMLTAKGEEIDKVLALELGADDYIVKPFSPREVVARVKAVLRRFGNQESSETKLSFPDFEINISNYEVLIHGEKIAFTPKEVELLHLLASHPGRVFEREQILSSVWGYDYFGDTRVVDTQIKRIRQKLPDNMSGAIKSIYGVGYKFEI